MGQFNLCDMIKRKCNKYLTKGERIISKRNFDMLSVISFISYMGGA